jgi:hypothetical protein
MVVISKRGLFKIRAQVNRIRFNSSICLSTVRCRYTSEYLLLMFFLYYLIRNMWIQFALHLFVMLEMSPILLIAYYYQILILYSLLYLYIFNLTRMIIVWNWRFYVKNYANNKLMNYDLYEYYVKEKIKFISVTHES